jgi:hypothetical protein
MKAIHDKPVVDLISPENIRFEPGCDWRDPVGSSPYIIELMPMYIGDVLTKMESGEWHSVSESALRAASDRDDDQTRRSRESGRVPGKDKDSWKPKDYDICWVRANIIKWNGQDWHYYTLAASGEILTDPVPLRDVYLHGERPYVIGFTMMETHKTYPSGKLEMVRDLQRAANDIWNMRYDNLKLNLNPRQFIRTGVATEISDVRSFAPGKVVVVNTKPSEDMRNAIQWDRPPPMDEAAAYQEQDRINLDTDQLTGAFTNSSVQASQLQQQSATGMHLMSGEASGLNEYELRCFAETFVEKLVRLLMKLEQAYEVDPVILAIAGKNSQIYQKYGINEITDALIEGELTTKVNVGVGASNPQMRLKNFIAGADILGKIFGPAAATGANFPEVAKEVFGMLGYSDGSRFFNPEFDPRVEILQKQLDKAKGAGGKGGPTDQGKIQSAQIQAQAHLQAAQTKAQADVQMTAMEAQAKQQQMSVDQWKTMFKGASDNAMVEAQLAHSGQQQRIDRGHDAAMQHNEIVHQAAIKGVGDDNGNVSARTPTQGVVAGPRATQPPASEDSSMSSVVQILAALTSGIQQGNAQLAAAITENTRQMTQALAAVVRETNAPVMQSMAHLAQSHANMASALSARRRLIRGPDGRAEGVEIVDTR